MSQIRVATIAVRKGSSLLLGLRRDNHLWTNPRGHLEGREQPLFGAMRELQEETGIIAQPFELVHLGSGKAVTHTGKPLMLYMYEYRTEKETTPYLDPDSEVYGWHFFDISKGLSQGIVSALHSPKNYLLKKLGLIDFEGDLR